MLPALNRSSCLPQADGSNPASAMLPQTAKQTKAQFRIDVGIVLWSGKKDVHGLAD